MTARAVLLLIACAVLAPVAARAGPPQGRLTTVQVPKGHRLEAATLADVNGDGRRDLVLAEGSRHEDFERSLRIHYFHDEEVCFGANPDVTIPLERAVVAFGVADVGPGPGDEVLLYGATGASVLPTGKADAHPEKIVDAEFLWQLPAPREAFFWAEGAKDLDGDGLPDLLLPEPDGYRLARQVKGEDGARSFDVRALRYPGGERGAASPGTRRMEARAKYREIQISFSLGEGKSDESLLQVMEGIPNPVFSDYDGDGRPDLFALSGDELNVWRQGADGTFPATPTWRLRFPVTVDQGRRLDLSFGTRVGDLTGDGRADCVILAGDRSSEEIRTQILIYTQHGTKGLFADGGRPDQVLFVLGFAGATDLVDVDGDRDLDLVFGTVKLDSIDKLLAVSGGGVEAEFRVHLNEKQPGRRVFSQSPDFALRVKIESDSLREAGRRISAKFIPDVTGDGRPDLLLRPTPEILRILPFRRIGNALRMQEQPFWQTRVHEDADLRVVEGLDGAPPELLLSERRQVHHVRFTR